MCRNGRQNIQRSRLPFGLGNSEAWLDRKARVLTIR